MKKLELEYDYDTDEEQLHAAKSMLLRENLDAIQFYVKDGDPLLLVENLNYQNGDGSSLHQPVNCLKR